MRTRDKQNKHKLKFDYIAHLQALGKIWKEHSSLVSPDISKTDSIYNNEVINQMSASTKKEYCSILYKCDDILLNITKVDVSLKNSHQKFLNYKKIIKGKELSK